MRLIGRVLLLAVALQTPYAIGAPVELFVNATDVARKIVHARLIIPVSPGPLTLVYPKWIPGEHSPNGPISNVAGLRFVANGRDLPWRRDLLDMYSFHIQVPSDVDKIEAFLDYLPSQERGFGTARASVSASLAILNWNQVLLYPSGTPAEDIPIVAAIRLPSGWKYASALAGNEEGGRIVFGPVSMAELIDSPLITGRFFRRIALPGDTRRTYQLDIAADSEAALQLDPALVKDVGNLITETEALFQTEHYSHYDFLCSLSNYISHFGLEHHESSDDRFPETRFLAGQDEGVGVALAHEFVHSWNGKYRQPLDLVTSDYQTPRRTDLLWVYEGLTVYLASVLATRSGFWSPELYRDNLALMAARLENVRGRTWRPLQDTADAAQLFYFPQPAWTAWRRFADFYDEGALIWLEADSIIRQRSGGVRSLDDFCRAFFGGKSGPLVVKPYTFDQMIAAINQVQPYSWREFFTARLNGKGAHAPLAGIAGDGWRLTYTEHRSDVERRGDSIAEVSDFSFSIGVQIANDGGSQGGATIIDVVPGSSADQADLGPGMRIVAVDGRRWSDENMRQAISAAKATNNTIDLVAENDGLLRAYRLSYHSGDKYPHLVRDLASPDLLSDVLKPLRMHATEH